MICASKGIQVAHIHDSFWGHPNNMNEVREAAIEVFVEIAKSDLLADILSEITGENIEIEKDSYDLHELIKDAEYILS